MSQATITAAKLKGDFCDYSFKEFTQNGSQHVEVKDCEVFIHEDLRNKFSQLIPHLILLCEQIPSESLSPGLFEDFVGNVENDVLFSELSCYKVTGWKISGSGENQGVTIIGKRKLSTEKVLNLNTPFIKFEDEYQYANELRIAVTECQQEVIEYMQGKKAPDAQLSLFGEEGDEIDVQISFGADNEI